MCGGGGGGQITHVLLFTAETEESEAARAARMEIVAALKSRKAAMEEKLKAKMEELKKICLEEGALSGQLPPEYPLSPGEAPPTIRRRVGTSFTLPENLLNKAKSSKVRGGFFSRVHHSDSTQSLL